MDKTSALPKLGWHGNTPFSGGSHYLSDSKLYLVGGFKHFFIFPNSWDDDPIWLSYFSGGLKPPTRYNTVDFGRLLNHRNWSKRHLLESRGTQGDCIRPTPFPGATWTKPCTHCLVKSTKRCVTRLCTTIYLANRDREGFLRYGNPKREWTFVETRKEMGRHLPKLKFGVYEPLQSEGCCYESLDMTSKTIFLGFHSHFQTITWRTPIGFFFQDLGIFLRNPQNKTSSPIDSPVVVEFIRWSSADPGTMWGYMGISCRLFMKTHRIYI